MTLEEIKEEAIDEMDEEIAIDEAEVIEEIAEAISDENEEAEETLEITEENEETPEAAEEEAKPDANEIAYLKAELDSLKRELAESRAFYSRLEVECSEFSELYPDVRLSSLPDSIWQSVKSGIPLAAAYALEEKRARHKAIHAQKINGENRNMSSGSLSADSRNDYFSPSEVRAMSAAEVRANYTKIISSMSKWH